MFIIVFSVMATPNICYPKVTLVIRVERDNPFKNAIIVRKMKKRILLPPGTGVIQLATCFTSLKSTSPTSLWPLFLLASKQK